MATTPCKKLSKSKYKGVYHFEINGIEYWTSQKVYKGIRKIKNCKTEKEAAIVYDVACIGFGLAPVNILKPTK